MSDDTAKKMADNIRRQNALKQALKKANWPITAPLPKNEPQKPETESAPE